MPFLAVEDHRIALEEIARIEAEKNLFKTTGMKVVDTVIQYGKDLLFPNILAASLGYQQSGQDGMLDALVQVNLVAGSITAGFGTIGKVIYSIMDPPLSSDQRTELETKLKVLTFSEIIKKTEESILSRIVYSSGKIGIMAGIYAGVGYALQALTEIPMNEGLLAGIGIFHELYTQYLTFNQRRQLKRRIIDYVQDYPDTIEERKGKPVDEIMLVSMIKYAQEHYSTLYPANTPDTKNKSLAQKVVANMLTSPKPNVDIIIRNCPTVEINFPQQRDEIANTYYFTISCLDRIAEVLQTKTKYTVSRPLETQLESGDGEYLFQIVPKSIGDHGLKIKLHSPNSVGIIPPIFASLYDRELRTGDLNPSLLKALE